MCMHTVVRVFVYGQFAPKYCICKEESITGRGPCHSANRFIFSKQIFVFERYSNNILEK